MNPVIFPGSFDPVTNGHIDLIYRARAIFGAVRILICHNARKQTRFTVEERLAFLKDCFQNEPNISWDHTDGLLTDYLKNNHFTTVIRGLRSAHDWNHERTNAWFNQHFYDGIETVFLPAREKYMFLSSSAVKEAAAYGADITDFVPACVVRTLKK